MASTQHPELMRAVIDYAADGIITIDAAGTIISFNPACEAIFGYGDEEVIGQNLSMLMPARLHDQLRQKLKAYAETGEDQPLADLSGVSGVRKSGEEFPVEWSINAMHVDGQHLFVIMLRDATDQQRAEQRQRHVHKMEAMGELVGGVAHNFNNLLAAIVGNVGLARFEARDMPQLITCLDNIEEISMRAGRMVEQLLVFASRDYFTRKQTIPLSSLVREGFEIARAGVNDVLNDEGIVFMSLDIRDDRLAVYGDANQLRQVVVNIIDNARQALEGSREKRVDVVLERVTPDFEFFTQHFELEEGDYARLQISDTGCGMDAKTMVKMFEPFFTTREVGQGIGLGLSTAFGTVSSHNGVIDVDSRVGEGSMFTIWLPLVETGVPEDELPEEER